MAGIKVSLFSFMLIKAITSFSYFYVDDLSQLFYKNEEPFIVRFTFTLSEDMTTCEAKIKQQLEDLVKPFSLTIQQIQQKSDLILLQVNDFTLWYGKLKKVSTDITALLGAHSIIEEIPSDLNKTITIDKSFTSQKLADIDLSVKNIVSGMKQSVTLEALKNNKAVLTKVVTAFGLVNNDLAELVSALYAFSQTLKLSAQYMIAKDIKIGLIPTKGIIDATDITIIKKGLVDKAPTYFIKPNKLTNPVNYNALVPIPYFEKSLGDSYYLNKQTNKFEKKFTNFDKTLSNKSLMQCLQGLNANDNNKVFNNCKFHKNLETFILTKKGIIISNATTNIIYLLNAQFNIQLKQDSFPVYIEFKGTLSFVDPNQGTISITRNSDFKLQYTIFTAQQLQTFKNLNKPSFSDFKQNVLQALFHEEYDLIILNVSLVFGIVVLFVSIKMIYIKCNNKKPYNRPIHKVITKRLRANRSRESPYR